MTSTPVSLNDESLNGSWIDINSASQIHSPMDDDSPEFLRPPYSLAESVQNLGLISFQVERFLQETQRNNSQSNLTTTTNNGSQQQTSSNNQQQQIADNISDMYLSDSDLSTDRLPSNNKPFVDSLRKHNQSQQQYNPSNNNNNIDMASFLQFNHQVSPGDLSQKPPKSGDCLLDTFSDSLSLLSRASLFAETNLDQAARELQEFNWLWDWTAQPEYFSGQEWKMTNPKQSYLIQQSEHDESARFITMLLFTNIISVLIGSGLTYMMIMRRS